MSTDTGFRDELPGVDRLLTLSDGVVAIAITLLVLQLNVPEPAKLTDPASASELATQLGKGADSLISYVISFYVIAQFWLVPPDHRTARGPGLVELRVPVHHYHHAFHQQSRGQVLRQSARRRHLRG
jgi:hypothetical protein